MKGTMFTSPFKILPLDYYDAILGMEWLQMFSPMNIEWKEKWLSFQYQGTQITLHGIKDTSCAAPEITVNQLLGMEKSQSIWGMVQLFNIAQDSVQQPVAIPFQIQQLVDSFQDLFAEPTGVPPIRALTLFLYYQVLNFLGSNLIGTHPFKKIKLRNKFNTCWILA
jgi:hypothetical protein